MKRSILALAVGLLASGAAQAAQAAEPVRIGVTSILSGPLADRGQSEQYGIELALARINREGGVLGRPVEAVYGDHGRDPQAGIRAVRRLIDEEHVPVIIGALSTPVTHAIMPVIQQAGVPLVIEISAGQDFVDASGVGGNTFAFKTIPSDLDIARGMIGWLRTQNVTSVAVVADANDFSRANAASMVRAAETAGIRVVANETVPAGTTDLAPLLTRLRGQEPDRVLSLLGPSTAAFFRAYEQSGWSVPIAGRIDFAAAMGAVSPAFLARGGLAQAASVSVFSPAIDTPGVRAFVAAYRSKYGIMPTQRAFFAYEAANLVVDAIRRAGVDRPAEIRQALASSTMPSLLGGTYAMDDHNHSHTPLQILGLRDGRVTVLASVPG